MSRSRNLPPELVAQLISSGDGAPGLPQKLEILKLIWELPGPMRDGALIELFKHIERQEAGLKGASEATKEFRQKVDELIGRLSIPAIFLGHVGEPAERRAWVQSGNAERVVGVSSDVPLDLLKKGIEVLLTPQQTAIVHISKRGFPRPDIATVAETTNRNSVIVRRQEEECELEMAEGLSTADLTPGDRIRYSRNAGIAYQKVEKTQKPRFLLCETPNVALSEVGGQDANLSVLLGMLSAGLLSPQRAMDYGLSGKCSILLTGSPGCGKTLLFRAAVTEIARMSGRMAKCFIVRPGELQHWLVGSSELAVRTLFQNMREAAGDGSLVVLFLDEVESVARQRGHHQGFYNDQLLNALLAEIDGFAGREGVALVATTNRKDLVDAAMLQRLSDKELVVGAPDMAGARCIMAIHLREHVPYHPNGTQAMDTRREIIATGVSLIYGPASQYAQLLRIKFRDATTRILSARDFVSGRLLAQICRAARQAALNREQEGGGSGVRVADMEEAVADAMEKVASSVTVFNVRNQVSDLPTDVEVVAVERIIKKVARPHRYLNPVLV